MLSRDVPEDGPRELHARPRYVHGATRDAGWIAITEIQCPREHHIKDGFISVAEDTFRCAKCGVMLWALFVPRLHIVMLAEVDLEDVRVIKTHQTIVETIRYLGIPEWPAGRVAQVRSSVG